MKKYTVEIVLQVVCSGQIGYFEVHLNQNVARMVEQVDTQDLKSCPVWGASSILALSTEKKQGQAFKKIEIIFKYKKKRQYEKVHREHYNWRCIHFVGSGINNYFCNYLN